MQFAPSRYARTSPQMSDFSDWQPLSTAPRDGTEFTAGNADTGSVYTTCFYPCWGTQREAEKGDLSQAISWWTRDGDSIFSFRPTHWRPGRLDRDKDAPPMIKRWDPWVKTLVERTYDVKIAS